MFITHFFVCLFLIFDFVLLFSYFNKLLKIKIILKRFTENQTVNKKNMLNTLFNESEKIFKIDHQYMVGTAKCVNNLTCEQKETSLMQNGTTLFLHNGDSA